MSEYDIPIYSGRQLWHYLSCDLSPDKSSMVFVQTSGGRVLPRYEPGPKVLIDNLSPLYQDIGNYLWSGQLEVKRELLQDTEVRVCAWLAEMVRRQDRQQRWKATTEKLIPYAVKSCKSNNQPFKGDTKPLYEHTVLEKAIDGGQGRFAIDHIGKWNFLDDTLTSWLNRAEQPLNEWVREKRRAA